MATDDGLDRIAVVERIENGEIALAGDTEDTVGAVLGEAVDEQIGGAAGDARAAEFDPVRFSQIRLAATASCRRHPLRYR